ncbi:MAG: hypothetical protein ACLQMO_17365 [Acidobacteriaceae bacterium]
MHTLICLVWKHLRVLSLAPLVTIEVAVVGLIVSWLQLRYMKRRDHELDIRNGWVEIHKLMRTFRFKRELLLNKENLKQSNRSGFDMDALESLHNLKGQLDRMPDGPLVDQIADLLRKNWQYHQWKAKPFEAAFDQYAREVALLTRPEKPTRRWWPWGNG